MVVRVFSCSWIDFLLFGLLRLSLAFFGVSPVSLVWVVVCACGLVFFFCVGLWFSLGGVRSCLALVLRFLLRSFCGLLWLRVLVVLSAWCCLLLFLIAGVFFPSPSPVKPPVISL